MANEVPSGTQDGRNFQGLGDDGVLSVRTVLRSCLFRVVRHAVFLALVFAGFEVEAKVSGTTSITGDGTYRCTLYVEAGVEPETETASVSVSVPDGDVAWVTVSVASEGGSLPIYCDKRTRQYPSGEKKFTRNGSFQLSVTVSKDGDRRIPVSVAYEVEFKMVVTYERKRNLTNTGMWMRQDVDLGDYTDDQNTYVSFSWRNNGNKGAPAFSSAVYLDGVLKKTISCSALAKGSSDSSGWIDLGVLPAGKHTVETIVDSGDAVRGETSESDNSQSVTFTVIEGAPTLKVSPTELSVDGEGGVLNLSIGGNVSWFAHPDCDWLTVDPPSGKGRATSSVTVKRNGSAAAREARVSLTGEGVEPVVVAVLQAGMSAPTAPVLEVGRGTSGEHVGLSWSASQHALDYLVYRSESAEMRNKTLLGGTAALAWQDATARPGVEYYYQVLARNEVGLTASGAIGGYRSTGLSVSALQCDFTHSGGERQIDVTSTAAWAVASEDNWIVLSRTADSDSFALAVRKNYTGKTREGTVRVTVGCEMQEIFVVQLGLGAPGVPSLTASCGTCTCGIELSWTASEFSAGDYQVFRAPVNGGDPVLIGTTNSLSWCDLTAAPGVAYHYWVVASNELAVVCGAGRTGYLAAQLDVGRGELAFASTGGVASVAVDANVAWFASSANDWIRLSDGGGAGNGMIGIAVDRNVTGQDRTGLVRIESASEIRTVVVRQDPAAWLDVANGRIEIDTGALTPTLTVAGGRTFVGRVEDGVAAFGFDYVSIGSGVTVDIRGERPLKLASESDMMIAADMDVSGSVAGRCGGGVGGEGGKGGEAAGGEGGRGGEGGVRGRAAYSGAAEWGSSGGCGESGDPGNRVPGESGGTAGRAFNSDVALAGGGAGGEGGNAGVAGVGSSSSNGGLGGYLSMQAPSFPSFSRTATHEGMTAGSVGNDGGNGGAGMGGGEGNAGFNDFASALETLALVAGSAGGGGGGGGAGGSGGGGQGGGGGGGSSAVPSSCEVKLGWSKTVLGPMDGQDGGAGGKGGRGGAGGIGGCGGHGGNGGGALVLKAAGRLFVSGSVEISGGGDVSSGVEAEEKGGEGAFGDRGGVPPWNSSWDIFVSAGLNVNGGLSAANGGSGGRGGNGGKGGAGGRGGYGAPGMVKLYGAEVDLRQAVVVADNGDGDTTDGRCGAVTYLSCLTDVQLASRKPQFRHRVLEGTCREIEELLVASAYDASVKVPVVSPLKGVCTGASGILDDSSPRLKDVEGLECESRSDRLALKRCSDFYAGFDQLFVEKVVADDGLEAIRIDGRPISLGRMVGGDVWTTCVPTGTAVSFDVEMVTVAFDADSGCCSEPLRRCIKSLPIGRLPVPEKEGAVFVGWFTGRGEDGELVTADAVAVAGTLYARWIAAVDLAAVKDPSSRLFEDYVIITNYSIAYADTKGCANVNPTTYTTEDVISFSALTNPPGWRFVGWEPPSLAQGSTGDKLVTAVWEEGNDEDSFEYEITSSGSVCILSYKGKERNVVIPPYIKGLPVRRIDGFRPYETETFNVETVTLPDTLWTIGDYAFTDCNKLVRITIPASVRDIAYPDDVFGLCSSLKAIEVAPENAVYKSENGCLLSKDGTTFLLAPPGLSRVEVPVGVKIMGINSCSDGELESVVIPEGVEELCFGVFAGAIRLVDVTIPSSVKRLGGSVFWNASALQSVRFAGNAPECGSSIYEDTPSQLVTYVTKGSTGWLAKDSSALPDVWPNDDSPRAIRFAEEGPTFYTISYLSNDGSGVMSNQTIGVGHVWKLPPCTLKPPVGKTRFAGWSCSNGRQYDDEMLVFDLGNVVMTAIWE